MSFIPGIEISSGIAKGSLSLFSGINVHVAGAEVVVPDITAGRGGYLSPYILIVSPAKEIDFGNALVPGIPKLFTGIKIYCAARPGLHVVGYTPTSGDTGREIIIEEEAVPMSSARIIFSTTTTQAIINTPQYGYESEINIGLRYKEHRGAKWGIFDRSATYDFRVLKTAKLRLTPTEQNDLNNFFLSPSSARGETVNLILGKKHTGFFPFGPDKGDVGTFTCRVLSYEQSGMMLSPYKQFETDISLVMVTAPGYTIPPQQKTAAGGLKIGTVSHIRYPQRGITPEPLHAISTILANNGAPYSVDNGVSGDAYTTTLDLEMNETTAAALLNYLVTSGRGNIIKIMAKDDNYIFGREKDVTGSYWSQLIDNVINIKHDRYNRFSMSLKFNLVKNVSV